MVILQDRATAAEEIGPHVRRGPAEVDGVPLASAEGAVPFRHRPQVADAILRPGPPARPPDRRVASLRIPLHARAAAGFAA